MRKIRTILTSGTILPSLLLSGFVNVQAGVAAPAAPGVIVLAQKGAVADPEENRRRQEEENRRRIEEEKLKQQQHAPATPPASATPHQTPPPAPPAPVQPKVVPQPPAPVHVNPPAPTPPPPVVPHAATPPAPPAPVQQKIVTPPPAPAPVQPGAVPHAATPVAPPLPNSTTQNPQPTRVIPLGTPVNPQFHPGGPAPQQPGQVPRPGTPVAPNAANGQPSTIAPQFPQQPQPQAGTPPKRNGITPLEAGAVGLAVGVVGGMIIGEHVRGLNEVQSSRQTVEQNGATFYSEPGRVIVREGDGLYVRHDETERFREFGSDVRVEQRGDQSVQIVNRPDGSKIITITDRNGQLLKRMRRLPNGTEIILIDNGFQPRPQHFSDEVIRIAPPPMDLPPERYELDASSADEGQIYDAISAPPLAKPPRRYTLDEIRYSRDLRQYMRSVELTTITFSTGSWAVEDSEIGNLKGMADAINRAVQANPNEIFLIEGHTDAVGSDVDNLSLSDRRAQTVASILTRSFNVPPENLTTQGYGSQFLKIQTSAAERENRRVALRRVTPLLAGSAR